MTTKASPAYTTRPLDADTWDDFARLVEANNGVWGGCWCMGFHPEGVGKGTTAAQNREAKREHVRRGTVHQILVYEGDLCIGWCQYGASAELPNIKNPKAYEKELTELPDWRIGCIFTDRRHRGEGVARSLGITRSHQGPTRRRMTQRHLAICRSRSNPNCAYRSSGPVWR